ncbi:VOC family protein [uncultured Sphingomonas sp.]|uniref:VOC family protein n=1 Tax=uncultured Sphingomonas sp. TaxID=158754 RepID=UPI0035CB63A5
MATPFGRPIWYELMTSDTAAAKAFYSHVIGWTTTAFGGSPEIGDYTIWSADAGQSGVGGMMKAPDGMDAPPAWYCYLHVADVDAACAAIAAAGGVVHRPGMDLPGVGRIAFVADPQGALFYVMTPDPAMGDAENTCFSPTLQQRVSWNELATGDQPGALDFYTNQFGWQVGGSMPMGDMGDYTFLNQGDVPLGAAMTRGADGPPPAWRFYWRVDEIGAANDRLVERGGMVGHGPVEVPGGDWVIMATDPQGAAFGLVGPRENAVE